MKRYRVRTISIALCLSLMVFANAGLAKEPPMKDRNQSHIELDPDNTGTYTGQAGKDNYIGNCSPCHGLTGKGDGPLADSLGEGVTPRNLNDAKLLSTRTDEFLFKVVKFGGVSVGLSESMPGWKDTFTDVEVAHRVLMGKILVIHGLFYRIGNMQVMTFSRRYSSSRSPYDLLWMTRILLLKPSTNPNATLFSGLQ